MAFIVRDDEQQQTRGDMTPMIDIIFLLLIFFILTTTFMAPEKAIASLMPTTKGGLPSGPIEAPQEINIRVWPAALNRHAGVQELDAAWRKLARVGTVERCLLQIGGGEPLVIDGRALAAGGDDSESAGVTRIHSSVLEQLRQREIDGARVEQDAINIHCFSGLPWKYAAAVYDAVRHYEELQTGERIGDRFIEQLPQSRQVAFAPPLLRRYHEWEHGNELHRIINLK